jgi:hypothetical protein
MYQAAARHVKSMPAAQLRQLRPRAGRPGTVTSALSVTGPGWEFIGPRNLDVPYQQYYGNGKVSGRVNAVAYDRADPKTLYAASAGGGLWRSADGGIKWSPMSDARRLPNGTLQPGWPVQQVGAIAISPADRNVIFAGLGDFKGGLPLPGPGGIMVTTDGGLNWLNTGAAQFGNAAVSGIVVSPENAQVVIVATARGGLGGGGEGAIWRSTTGAITWPAASPTLAGGGPLPGARWTALAMSALDPATNTRTYYAAGTTTPVAAVAATPTTPAIPAVPRLAVLLRSQDEGATWTQLAGPTTGGETVFPICASVTEPNTLYGLLPNSRSVWRSTDRGTSWTDISAGFASGDNNDNWRQLGYNFAIACGRREGRDILFVGVIDLVLSLDEGASWHSIGGPSYSMDSQLHNDQHAVAVHPTNPDEFLVGNDGGVYAGAIDTSHAGTLDEFPSLIVHLSSLNADLGITTFYSLATHPTEPDVMIGGAQDNATPVSTGDLKNWRNRGGGDGGGVAISQVRPNIQYATTQGFAAGASPPPTPFVTLDFYRTDAGWYFRGGPLAGQPVPQQKIPPFVGADNLPFTPAVAMDPSDSTVLYTGTQFLWRLDDRFPLGPWRWSRPNSSTALAAGGNVIRAIAVAPSDRNTIYTAAGGGQVSMSTDRGATWTRIDTGTAAACMTGGAPACPPAISLSVNPNDPNDVLVGFGLNLNGGTTATLWRCTGANAATRTWAAFSGTGTVLPLLPVNAIAREPGRPGATIFVGNDLGVFVSEDTGANWANGGTAFGLPNVQVTALVMNASTGFLNAATFGRGIWRIEVSSMGLPPP